MAVDLADDLVEGAVGRHFPRSGRFLAGGRREGDCQHEGCESKAKGGHGGPHATMVPAICPHDACGTGAFHCELMLRRPSELALTRFDIDGNDPPKREVDPRTDG